MIDIKITKSDAIIKSMEISGHSKYAAYGKDIVCSAVSGIVQGMFNAILKMCDKTHMNIMLNPKKDIQASIIVKNQNDKKLQLLLQAMNYQLITIQIQFPKYISMEEV